MKEFYTKLFCLLFLCVFTPYFAHAYQFTKDLKNGDFNDDVKILQKFLNQDSRTTVALSGSGSIGNETNYFGNMTKQAVVRFQEIYKDEILTPSGLSSGTGFVGPATRKKLINLSENGVVKVDSSKKSNITNVNTQNSAISSFFNEINPAEINKTNSYFGSFMNQMPKQTLFSISSVLDKATLSIFPSFAKEVRIYTVEPYQVKPGQKVIVNGTGFTDKNNIFSFGSVSGTALNCQYSTYCEVSVPENVGAGEQNVVLKNSNGDSGKQGYFVKVFVTNNPVMPSVISSVSPSSIKASEFGADIMIKGERFTSSNNYIYTPLGKVGPYDSSDGKIIVFSLKNMENINKLIESGKLLKAENVPIPFRISNEYGSSDVFFITLLINK